MQKIVYLQSKVTLDWPSFCAKTTTQDAWNLLLKETQINLKQNQEYFQSPLTVPESACSQSDLCNLQCPNLSILCSPFFLTHHKLKK